MNSSARNRRLLRPPFIALLAGAALLIAFAQPLQREFKAQLVLRGDLPPETLFSELATHDQAGFAFLERCYETGRLPQRLRAIREIRKLTADRDDLRGSAERLLTDAALDGDMSVREIALGTAAALKHSKLRELALLQLSDMDPAVRVLGIQLLRKLDSDKGTPIMISLLEDPSPKVVATADSVLRSWTGEDFGMRIVHTIGEFKDGRHQPPAAANYAAITTAVNQWNVWWETQQSEYPQLPSEPVRPIPSDWRLPIEDFSLRDLDGDRVGLSDFRGKVVLLNFWTTWCPSCLQEIPDLVDLKARFADELVILGISLDGQPDDHGHAADAYEEELAPIGSGNHEAVSHDDHEHAHVRDDDRSDLPDRNQIVALVRRTVKRRGITYPVLLDNEGLVSPLFHGEELPTNILIDPSGKMRRRFIGTRSATGWNAMVQELIEQEDTRKAR